MLAQVLLMDFYTTTQLLLKFNKNLKKIIIFLYSLKIDFFVTFTN